MFEEAIVFGGEQRTDEGLRQLFVARWDAFLFSKLADELPISADNSERCLQFNILKRLRFWQLWTEVQIQPRKPPKDGGGHQCD